MSRQQTHYLAPLLLALAIDAIPARPTALEAMGGNESGTEEFRKTKQLSTGRRELAWVQSSQANSEILSSPFQLSRRYSDVELVCSWYTSDGSQKRKNEQYASDRLPAQKLMRKLGDPQLYNYGIERALNEGIMCTYTLLPASRQQEYFVLNQSSAQACHKQTPRPLHQCHFLTATSCYDQTMEPPSKSTLLSYANRRPSFATCYNYQTHHLTAQHKTARSRWRNLAKC